MTTASSSPEAELPPRAAERLLIEALGGEQDARAGRVLCTSLGRGQIAARLARILPACRIECLYLDLYQCEKARRAVGDFPNCDLVCQPDFTPGEASLVAVPSAHDGSAELTRDLLQQGFEQLRLDGELWAAVDRPDDTWLRGEMEKLVADLVAWRSADGVVYRGLKKGPLKKRKNFDCAFPLRDGERTLTLFSRPGVFAHRRPDVGAKALIETLAIRATDRVFDIGCGSGAVTLACAGRADEGLVYAVDVNPRAVQCTLRGAEANQLSNVRVVLDADARCVDPGTFDLVVANPPYYSRQRIAEIFVRGALAALRPGGSLHFVTKHPQWYLERFTPHFGDLFVESRKGYRVVIGVGKNP